jgi:FkbH-like protein
MNIYNKLLKELNVQIKKNEFQKALKLLEYCIDLSPSYKELCTLTNIAKNLISNNLFPTYDKIKIAILTESTTAHLRDALYYRFKMKGVEIEVYESNFHIEADILNSKSPIYEFSPNYVIYWPENIHLKPIGLKSSTSEVHHTINELWQKRLSLIAAIKKGLPQSQIIHTTYVNRPERPLGHIENQLIWSQSSIVQNLNIKIRFESSADLSLLDLDYLASNFGKYNWFDTRLWHYSKHSFSLDAISIVTNEIYRLIATNKGLSAKCLVLDLDNTLWGGVIGDDDLDGIELGDSILGEAFLDFQKYVKTLKERGVLLAVCSKNNLVNAQLPFLKHPLMALKLEDISYFIANWNNKADNLKEIAENLDIGLESLVFFDDSPVERQLIRDLLPDVYTVEVPDDPSDFTSALDRLNLFDTTSITGEDLNKTNHYAANFSREELKTRITSLDEFLKSLEMKAYVKIISEDNYERALQLINKSNQFNLLTNRYTQSEFLSLLKTPNQSTIGLRLADKFGDYGTIAVVTVKAENGILYIQDWVMSCRVLSRGIEDFTFYQISKVAQKFNCYKIVGTYKTSQKNKLVSNLLEQMNMTCTDSSNEIKKYEIELKKYNFKNNFIEEHSE